MPDTKYLLLVVALALNVLSVCAQDSQTPDTVRFTTDSTWTSLSLRQWRFHTGDNPAWADPSFDDSDWRTLTTRTVDDSLRAIDWGGIGWWRIRVIADSASTDWFPMLFMSQQAGASEAYLNGKLVHRVGRPSGDPDREASIYLEDVAPIDLRPGENLLAVRYSYTKAFEILELFGSGWIPGPSVVLTEASHWQFERRPTRLLDNDIVGWVGGALFMMFLSHVLLFLFMRADRSNLYFALFAGLLLSIPVLNTVVNRFPSLPMEGVGLLLIQQIMVLGALAMLLAAVHQLLYDRLLKSFWVLSVAAIAGFVASRLGVDFPIGAFTTSAIMLELLRVTGVSIWKRKEGSRIIGAGVGALVVLWTLGMTKLIPGVTAGPMMAMTFPISVSVLLATRAARRNRKLQEQQRVISQHAEQLEEQVIERTAELKQSLEDLKNAQDQLIHAEKMASLGSLTAGIAHEIKNPLNFINNFAEVNTELAQELKEALANGENVDDIVADLEQNASVIAQHGKRADGIVRSMMQHARGGRGEREQVDLNALVKEYVALAYHGKRAQVEDFNVTIKEDLDPSMDRVSIVPQDIDRVLINLLGNAFDAVYQRAKADGAAYSPEVSVATHRSNGQVEICVSDNGPGVPEAIRKKIFEPFFTTKPTGSGTGVGLSLSYDIVAQGHGGSLRLENGEGGGAAFVVTLPTRSRQQTSDLSRRSAP